MKVGFTGTREGMTEAQKLGLKALLPVHDAYSQFHYGDCVGADAQARDVAAGMGMWLVSHPPDKDVLRAFTKADETREPKPYLERNKFIVMETERMIAAPRCFVESVKGGTWSTVRYARKLGRPIIIIWPDGSFANGQPLRTPVAQSGGH